MNPKVKDVVYELLDSIKNIFLINPLTYPDFIWMMNRSKLIISDSGGVQEEAPSLGKPVLVTRNTTERPEAVKAGTVLLVGSDENKIYDTTLKLFEDSNLYKKMSNLSNPYGSGIAAKIIFDVIMKIENL